MDTSPLQRPGTPPALREADHQFVAISDALTIPAGGEVFVALAHSLPIPGAIPVCLATITAEGTRPLVQPSTEGPWRYCPSDADGPVVLAIATEALRYIGHDVLEHFRVRIGTTPGARDEAVSQDLTRTVTVPREDAGITPSSWVRVRVPHLRLPGSESNITILTMRALDADGEQVSLEGLAFSDELRVHFLYLNRREPDGEDIFLAHVKVPAAAVSISAEVRNFAGPASVLVTDLDLQLVERGNAAILFDPTAIKAEEIEIAFVNDGEADRTIDVLYTDISSFGPRPVKAKGFEGGKKSARLAPGVTSLRTPVVMKRDTKLLQMRMDLPGKVAVTATRPAMTDDDVYPIKDLIEQLGKPSFQQQYEGLVVVYSTAGAFETGALPLRSHYIAREFARRNYLVLYFPMANEFPFGEVEPGLFQIPAKRFELLRSRLRIAQEFKRKIFICSTRCDAPAVMTLDTLKYLGWKVVFEVRDDMEGMRLAGFGKWYDPIFEDRFYRHSDCVICVSDTLHDRAVLKGAPADRTFVIKNGIDDETLCRAREIRAATTKLRRDSGHIGYFGHMFDGRFDRQLIEDHARASKYPYHLIGPGLSADHRFADLANVHNDDRMTINQFMLASTSWDVGVLPFRNTRLTLALDPIKQYLYLALGMKIVSAEVQEMRKCPLTWLYQDEISYARAIDEARSATTGEDDLVEADQFLDQSTWQKRTERQIAVIEGASIHA